MSTNGDGPTRINWQSLVATFGAVGTLMLGAYTYFEGQARDQAIMERNDRQRAICDSVNKLDDAMERLVRDAVAPRPGQSQAQMDAASAYKDNALEEIRRARCYVADVDPNKNPLGLGWIGG